VVARPRGQIQGAAPTNFTKLNHDQHLEQLEFFEEFKRSRSARVGFFTLVASKLAREKPPRVVADNLFFTLSIPFQLPLLSLLP
jgi:hypothetical protein